MQSHGGDTCNFEHPTTQTEICSVFLKLQCDDQSDCDEDECCLEVTRKEDKRHGNHNYNSTTFCFPHVDEDEACDLNGNWSCPCRDGLSCTEGGRSRRKRKAKKEKDYSKYYRPKVTWEEGEACPTPYKKSNKKPSKDTPTCQQVPKLEQEKYTQGRFQDFAEGGHLWFHTTGGLGAKRSHMRSNIYIYIYI